MKSHTECVWFEEGKCENIENPCVVAISRINNCGSNCSKAYEDRPEYCRHR
jgi:hypothetical protein